MNLDWIGWILFLMFFGLVSMPWWVIVIQIVWGDPYGPFVGDDTSSDPTSVDTRNFVFVRDLSPDEDDDGDDVDLDCDPDGIEIPDPFAEEPSSSGKHLPSAHATRWSPWRKK